jgi:hypothetical protein
VKQTETNGRLWLVAVATWSLVLAALMFPGPVVIALAFVWCVVVFA